MRNKIDLNFWIITSLAVFAIYSIRQALIPFLIAFVIAYLLDPLLDWMESKKIPRTFGVIFLIGIVGAALLGAILFLYPIIETQVLKGVEQMPKYVAVIHKKTAPYLEKLSSYDQGQVNNLIQETMGKLGTLPVKILKYMFNFVVTIFSSVAGLVSALLGFIIVPVVTFYFMRDIDMIMKRVETLIPERSREDVMTVMKDISKTLSAFVRGQLVVALAMSVYFSVGLYFIGIPMGISIGILSGFANLVPYLPLVAGFVPSLILSYLEYGFDWHMLAIIGLFAVAQLLDGFYLTPKIMGDKVGLHPVAIMFALLVGGLFFGIIGLILAVPVAAVIKVLLAHAEKKYRSSDFYNRKRSLPENDEQ